MYRVALVILIENNKGEIICTQPKILKGADSLELKAIGRCEKINAFCECNISVALGCSGPCVGEVIKIDASHHYYVPQQRQEHSIHHSLKPKMYFHNFP